MAGFAEVVRAGPDELAGVFGVVADGEPLVEVVRVFCADDFAGGLLRVGGEDFFRAIILADDVEHVGEAVVVIVTDVGAEEGLGYGAGGIDFVEGVDDALQFSLGEIGLGGVVDFVAGAPEDDAGVIAVTHGGVLGVADVPLVEVQMVVKLVFAHRPHVEHFVHDEEAQAVGEIEELG